MDTAAWSQIRRKNDIHVFDNYEHKNSVILKSREPECIVWGALALVLRVSRLAGVAPLRLARVTNGWRASVAPSLSIYNYLLLLILLAGLFSGLYFDLKAGPKNAVRTRSPTSKFTWISELVIIIPVAVIGVFEGPKRMRSILEYQNTINDILKKLSRSRKWQPKETKKTIIAAMSIFALNGINFFDFCMYIADMLADHKQVKAVYLYSCFYCITMLLHYVQLQFAFVAWLVETALVSINKALESVIFMINLQSKNKLYSLVNHTLDTMKYSDKINLNVSEKSQDYRTFGKYRDTIMELATFYGTSFDVMRKINQSFTTVLVILMVSFFWHLVITPYYFVVYLYSKKIRVVNALINVIFFMTHTSNLLLIIEPGHQCKIQMDQTRMLVSQLLRQVRVDDPLVEVLYYFNKQITLNDINFTVAESCTLTRPLILGVFGGVTTYMMLILQAQVLDDNNW